MTDDEKLKAARTALESIGRNLSGVLVLLRLGNLVDGLKVLEHIQKRAEEIYEEVS